MGAELLAFLRAHAPGEGAARSEALADVVLLETTTVLTSIWRLRTLASSSHGAFSFARQTHTTSAFLALNARGQHSANTKGSATPVVSNTIVSMGVFFLMAAAINSLVRL